VYLTFTPKWRPDLEDIQQELAAWASRYNVRYTTKFIKGVLRVGFDKETDFTLFTMTWAPDLEENPNLAYKVVNIVNERY
jgi:hypothetical protein